MKTLPRFANLATHLSRAAFVLAPMLVVSTLSSSPARAADGPGEGLVRVERTPDRSYRSLALALDAAEDGDVVELGPGTFRGAVVVTGKSVEIRGAGADRSTLEAPGTVVQAAADGRLRLVDVTVASTGRDGAGLDPALLGIGDGLRVEDCVIRGARGFGVEVRSARHDVEIVGNTIRGNGGGLRFTASVGRVHGNVIADNRGPGLLVDGALPEDGLIRLSHNTIVRNGDPGGAPITATGPGGPDAALPELLQHRLWFSWNVASGRLTEGLLTEESRAQLQQRNVLVWPDKVLDVFEDAEEGDYRPEDALPTDPAGVEMGARLSEDAEERLGPAIEAALERGRLAGALALARRAPRDERTALWDRIREALYARYARYVEAEQPGLAVRDFFLALPAAPAGWNIGGRFEQALERVAASYGQTVDWNGIFPAHPSRKAHAIELVTRGGIGPGRPGAGADGEAERWTVVCKETKDLLLDRHTEPLEEKLVLANPEHEAVARTLRIERSRRERLDEQRRKVAAEVEAYEAQHGASSRSGFLRAKRRELDRRSQSLVDAEIRIRELEQTLAQVPETYSVDVTGKLEHTDVMAEVTLTVTDPVGRVHESVIPFRREERFLSLEPIRLLGFEGIAPRPIADERERARYGQEVVEKALVAAVDVIEARDLDRLEALLDAARKGAATNDDWNELFSLLAVYADRFEKAIAAERPARELREARERYPAIERPRFQLVHDPTLKRKPPLRFVVETNAARRQAERLLGDLESRYDAYWALLPALRALFEEMGGRPFEEFVRIVRGHEG